MPVAKPVKVRKRMGRPVEKEIDWKLVLHWMRNLYTLNEIATHFRTHPEHFRKRFKQRFNRTYAEMKRTLEGDVGARAMRKCMQEAFKGKEWALKRMMDLYHPETRKNARDLKQAGRAEVQQAVQVNAAEETNQFEEVVIMLPAVSPQTTSEEIDRLIEMGEDVTIEEINHAKA